MCGLFMTVVVNTRRSKFKSRREQSTIIYFSEENKLISALASKLSTLCIRSNVKTSRIIKYVYNIDYTGSVMRATRGLSSGVRGFLNAATNTNVDSQNTSTMAAR